jgi:hypothetical protein
MSAVKQACADWPTGRCFGGVLMSGKSRLVARAEQRDGLLRLAVSANRAEAARRRGVLLSLFSLILVCARLLESHHCHAIAVLS